MSDYEDLLKKMGITTKQVEDLVKHIKERTCVLCIQDLIRIQYAYERIMKHVAESAE